MDLFLNHTSFSSSSSPKASRCGSIQGQLLEVTVLAGYRLKNTEKFCKQDPYVYVQYGGTEYRTETCTDGGTNPVFQDKFQLKLIEGLSKLKIRVLNSNTFTADDFIGRGTVYLEEVLAKGCVESSCNLLSEDNRSAGEIRLILRYPNAQKLETKRVPPPPQPAPFQPPPRPKSAFYQAPPPQYHPPYPPYPRYEPPPPPPQAVHPPPPVYPPPPGPSQYFAPPSPYHGIYPPPPPPYY